ncbi:alkanesulfonate monooxygenase SsuD/methylene tetrahydromethanopterin reductase-like flavin-dependent oxidoreductase (luciferase family) [Kineococcus rhizosphaerae]|uniref:Alkanesulfonate monooxygenase SsuD/methylene tetrahydromethanopterin reductase-like flavin-dependent oxidoreductase (Luciferase family) n=1 Tax=Kineococcus rhizosphaerae TaxID=559628 RepID=A0A2T0R171_9ACTN|nr:LLM class flavin-dependent oxidoreductase [Kineococcus rhizosphaerae]PRY13075.1 alkanesulfonate monooxygenase SsuD/methylene tetrahydromethanopterin reductase-like flavin-dependent oxidoreductase (luciferase family) [Kineococcus rhizosphaerae]
MSELHLSVALESTGWHPASWREPGARADELFTAAFWRDTVREAERGLFDLVTIEDSFSLQGSHFGLPDDRTDRVAGRLDALLVAARLALVTQAVGLVPTVTTTHTEPFHVSKALATLDHVSSGRGGWRAQIAPRAHEAELFGRRSIPVVSRETLQDPEVAAAVEDLFAEGRAVVDTVRALWDSWEDDAEIRDVASGRFVDRTKLHRVAVETPWFSVLGPSITPRPPQGQPVVTALAHARTAYEFAAASADVVFVTPHEAANAREIVAEVRAAEAAVGRTGTPLQVHADLVVALGPDAAAARNRLDRLDTVDGEAFGSDALVVADSPAGLVERLLLWREAGIEGFRFRPAVNATDLPALVDEVVPLLQSAGVFRREYTGTTLRDHLGLARPVNRYAAV